ncbi:hypothetical protein M3925_000983, partial [Vibrio metschnikovii]|nr:hypothetical protein [Vibrio metschnikovii]
RAKVSFYDKDRYFSPDIQQANELLKQAVHNALMPEGLLPSVTHHVTM